MYILNFVVNIIFIIKLNIYLWLQGLEIVNPQAAEKKVNEANAKYFSNIAGFLKVKKT